MTAVGNDDTLRTRALDRGWITQEQAASGEPLADLVESALARLSESNANYHEALRRFLLEGESYAVIAPAVGKS